MTSRPRAAECATIVLAAGASSRMGRPKMLLPVGGRTLLAASVAPHLEVVSATRAAHPVLFARCL